MASGPAAQFRLPSRRSRTGSTQLDGGDQSLESQISADLETLGALFDEQWIRQADTFADEFITAENHLAHDLRALRTAIGD